MLQPVVSSIIVILATCAVAQPAVAKPATQAPCSAPEYHQLDFWIGRWDVYDSSGTLIAHSLIERVYDCGIRENWMPLGKKGGGSLSIYVPAEGHWEQFWIDATGSRAFFTGRWNGHAMVISGRWAGPLVRMTYSKNADGSVRQLGERSINERTKWTQTFDFTYRRSRYD